MVIKEESQYSLLTLVFGAYISSLNSKLTIHMFRITDGKRKASDEPSSPTSAKRAKHDEASESDKEKKEDKAAKPVLKRIPFPEKV